MGKLFIKGARQNNLKDISISIDHGSITCISGPSGAGKSSLVFDILYSEAQRRYIETFSPYARQFLERLPEPKCDQILNLPAAIAVKQANPVRNSRSTVGTLSEITYFTRMLFFRNAVPFCEECHLPAQKATWQELWNEIQVARKRGVRKAWLTIRVEPSHTERLLQQGYRRAILQGSEIELTEEPGLIHWIEKRGEKIDLVIDRFLLASLRQDRLGESAQLAFSMGDGKVSIIFDNGKTERFSTRHACRKCGKTFQEPEPFLFSFNSPHGACTECKGFGRTTAIDWGLVVPDESLSIAEGAIKPLENWQDEKKELISWCLSEGIDITTPWNRLTPWERDAVLNGSEEWYGIKAIFDWLETKRYKAHVRILLARYRAYLRCPKCHGTRFKPLTLCYRLADKNIAQFYSLTVEAALDWCRDLRGTKNLDEASETLLDELERRLSLMANAGLGYLTLDRQSRTLSGGELSRLCISKAISTRLSDVLYCLEEPSSGLHPRDVKALGKILKRLKDSGNTLLLVENDKQLQNSANKIIELGPGSGSNGGNIVKGRGWFQKMDSDSSVKRRPLTASSCWVNLEQDGHPFLEIQGAAANNLKHISCRIPLGAITCICGVSGSGKSTLIEECLYRGLLRLQGKATTPPGKFDRITGWEWISEFRLVDQEPVSKNPRACPGTYLKLLDPIRKLLASTRHAKAAGLKPGYFSMNVAGGRCEHCKGQGVEIIEMQFLPDVTLPCPECKGKRFSQEALEYEFRGRNIVEILSLTIDEASRLFEDSRQFKQAVEPARKLGLGYLILGQPLNTLSAGEAQRLKIAKSLRAKGLRNRLIILDEPTRGLHPNEIHQLIDQLRSLASEGNSVIVVEHDLEVLKASDWIIELGPEGGEAGGRKIFEGPPTRLFQEASTPTALSLKDLNAPKTAPKKIKTGNTGHKPKRRPSIEIKGARHHNLKNIHISIPKNKLVVITGVSGSGKSSIAFDLIHREAQRRYLESLPSYMKQFVRLHEHFDVDQIKGLSPSVSIEQKVSRAGTMSTVATLTETAHYLRLLYANLAHPHCPKCAEKMGAGTYDDIRGVLLHHLSKGRIMLLSPRIIWRKGWHRPEIQKGFSAGASMVRVDGRFYSPDDKVSLSRYKEHNIDWVWGPLEKDSDVSEDLDPILKKALSAGSGMISILNEKGTEVVMSLHYFCPVCKVSVPSPDPLLFSFHTSSGRCPECRGTGMSTQGGTCSRCRGSRLSERAMIWKIGDMAIHEFFSLEIGEAEECLEKWLKSKMFPREKQSLATVLLSQAIDRLRMLINLGLDYLPLDRTGNTLSGGESQRIRLAAQAASNLTGLTIVLDEPTIGLHPSDNRLLINTLLELRDKGNTVIVVEHDEETIKAADWIIDMGPGGGSRGGRVVAQGPLSQIERSGKSATAMALKRKKCLAPPSLRLRRAKHWLRFEGASKFNLKDLSVTIPCGAITVITGVSGSGKSTLLNHIILEAILNETAMPCAVHGTGFISRTVRIDHSPIGRTPRSCPATYTGIWNDIRFLFSRTQAARIQGFGPGHFSYNIKAGRCEHCKGQGITCQHLSFLPDVYVTCEKCRGKRFKREILDITWKGKNISDVLEMSIDEASDFFKAIPGLRKRLSFMQQIGLGYLRLGQPSPTLSGGEAQRLKLAKELSQQSCRNSLYLLDEPTMGLHMADVDRLNNCLEKLADSGSTVVVVEHNLDLITRADWIIDLGPGSGKKGGTILFQGPLRDFIKAPVSSKTAVELRSFIRADDLLEGEGENGCCHSGKVSSA